MSHQTLTLMSWTTPGSFLNSFHQLRSLLPINQILKRSRSVTCTFKMKWSSWTIRRRRRCCRIGRCMLNLNTCWEMTALMAISTKTTASRIKKIVGRCRARKAKSSRRTAWVWAVRWLSKTSCTGTCLFKIKWDNTLKPLKPKTPERWSKSSTSSSHPLPGLTRIPDLKHTPRIKNDTTLWLTKILTPSVWWRTSKTKTPRSTRVLRCQAPAFQTPSSTKFHLPSSMNLGQSSFWTQVCRLPP